MLKGSVVKATSIVSILFALMHLLGVFIHLYMLNQLNYILLLFLVFLSLLLVKGTARVIGYFLFAAGGVLLLLYHAPLSLWIDGLTRNVYLVVMFTLVPLLAIPVYTGGYVQALNGFYAKYARRNSQFYLLASALAFFIAVTINLAAISLVYQVSLASEKSKNLQLLSTGIVRGVSASLTWAPSYAAAGIIMELTGIKWLDFFPYGFLIGLCAVFTGWVMTYFREGKVDYNDRAPTNLVAIAWRKVHELIAFAIVLIGFIITVSLITDMSTIIVVSISAILFPISWLAATGKLSLFVEEVKGQYFQEELPKLNNIVVLSIGAGFLATAISYSHVGDVIPNLLYEIIGDNGTLLSILTISAIAFFALFGVHPIILVTILGTTIYPQSFGISDTMMGLILLCGWSLANVISPSSSINVAMAGVINRSTLEVGPKWNGVYALNVMIVMVVILRLFSTMGLV